MRNAVIAMIAVGLAAACGGDGGDDGGGDDGNPAIDGPRSADGPPSGLSCAAYCATIAASCTGAIAQFGSLDTCMATCATWPEGTMADTTGNTLGCRTYHADLAVGSPAVHCRHAGPGGDDACGTNCDGFCTLVVGVCTGANEVYADRNECLTACAGFPTDPPYSAMGGLGNSLACRLYHATVASTLPDDHCVHTAAVSTPCS